MTTYYLNLRSQFKTLSFTLFVWLALTVLVFLDYVYDSNNSKIYQAYLIVFVISCGPSLLLYLIYLYHSIGRTVVIDRHEQKISVISKKSTLTFPINEIEKVVKVCSYPVGENRTQWLSTDPFFYIRIIMKDNQTVIITSLMTDSHFSIYGFKPEIEKKLIPFI